MAIKHIKELNEEFERVFWSGTSLNELFAGANQNAKLSGPMERIFASGMREYQKLRERRISDAGTLMDGARRAMRASFQREMDMAESQLAFLATVGSISPYIGLFAAIPAVISYNRFAHDVDRIAIKLETFIEEFSNILQRNLGAQAGSSTASGH